MTVSCSACMTASAIVCENDSRTGQTFWLCPACWSEFLHGLDEPQPSAAQVIEAEPVPGGERVCPTCHHRMEIAS
jgi:hypothetical protein